MCFPPDFGERWPTSDLSVVLGLGSSSGRVVCDSAQQPIGFGLMQVIGDEAELLLLGVRPDFQRRSIGQSLLLAILDDLQIRGVRTVFLEVRSGNLAAEAMYKKMGFKPIGRRINYYCASNGAQFDAITLKYDLFC